MLKYSILTLNHWHANLKNAWVLQNDPNPRLLAIIWLAPLVHQTNQLNLPQPLAYMRAVIDEIQEMLLFLFISSIEFLLMILGDAEKMQTIGILFTTRLLLVGGSYHHLSVSPTTAIPLCAISSSFVVILTWHIVLWMCISSYLSVKYLLHSWWCCLCTTHVCNLKASYHMSVSHTQSSSFCIFCDSTRSHFYHLLKCLFGCFYSASLSFQNTTSSPQHVI